MRVSGQPKKDNQHVLLPASCRQNDVIGEVLLRYKEASLWAAVITQFISTNMIVGFNEFHEFCYEFQAISTATSFQLVCFGGHFITADHILSLHFLMGWLCLC
jgi:hypothetical protein